MNIDHMVESALHMALEPTILTQNAGISKDSDLSCGVTLGLCPGYGFHLAVGTCAFLCG